MPESKKPAPRRAVKPPRRGWVVWLIIAVLVLGGVGFAQYQGVIDIQELLRLPTPPLPTPTPNPTTPTPTPIPTPTDTPSATIPKWPLTGVQSGVFSRPALIALIDNSRQSRPQVGLYPADLVVEYVGAEGDTKLAAIFHSSYPQHLAPIRQLDSYDQSINNWLRGLMVVSSQPWDATGPDIDLQILSKDRGAKGFTQIEDRTSPYDIDIDPSVLLAQADSTHTESPPDFCLFDNQNAGSTAQIQGVMTTNISIQMSAEIKLDWKWGERSAWMRYENGEEIIGADNSHIKTTNLVILEVDLNPADHPMSIAGGGKGLVASGQMSTPITWQKASGSAPWQFFDSNGQPITLIPGSTWLELVPTKTKTWSVS